VLLAVSLAALAAGLWAGRPAGGPSAGPAGGPGWRWSLGVVAFVAAGAFAEAWNRFTALPRMGAGRALGVLFLLACPAYAGGLALAGLEARRGGAVGAVLAGAAAGALVAGAALIPHFDPGLVYGGAAGALALAALVDAAGAAGGAPEGGSGPMRGKVVIVTGVGRRGQVGYALAEAFLAAGARVVVTDVRAEVEAHARELAARGEVVGVAADLATEEGAHRVVETARERFGRLDVLVNAAGGLGVAKPLAETTPDEWQRELDRNARTAYLVTRAALPLLRESRGAVINFASPAGVRARGGLAAYSAAKAAVVALTRATAIEERDHGVRVNAVAPGMVDTEENRAAVPDPSAVRWVMREQLADVVLFLASDAARGISGETIHVLGVGVE